MTPLFPAGQPGQSRAAPRVRRGRAPSCGRPGAVQRQRPPAARQRLCPPAALPPAPRTGLTARPAAAAAAGCPPAPRCARRLASRPFVPGRGPPGPGPALWGCCRCWGCCCSGGWGSRAPAPRPARPPWCPWTCGAASGPCGTSGGAAASGKRAEPGAAAASRGTVGCRWPCPEGGSPRCEDAAAQGELARFWACRSWGSSGPAAPCCALLLCLLLPAWCASWVVVSFGSGSQGRTSPHPLSDFIES